ncbi:Uncharacterised protein [Mycobacteroides abscessus subsp. abscessus]|nr:Uncharacterised protein [Mycobacteroides abscessus subsp. abscessus]
MARRSLVDFTAQRARSRFSPDFKMQAIHLSDIGGSSNTVGYYDISKQQVVNVTKIVQPTVGDFEDKAVHSGGSFTTNGLFKFRDVKANKFKYFDTKLQRLVDPNPEPEYPQYFTAAAETGSDLPDADVRESVWWPNEFTTHVEFKTCSGSLWVINDHEYLRSIDIEGKQQLTIEAIPAAKSACEEHGTVVTPLSPAISAAAADPSGSNILFVIPSPANGFVLYKADRNNPDSPTKIDLSDSGGLGDYANYSVAIVEWK